MYLKTIDKYLINQFIGPFIATFFIALFVLMMQFIWVYVDDIVGKGAGFGLVLEVIFYKSVSLIPWALPVAILISSVMVLGNLGERYELASLKSAGVPLIRVIRPMLYFAIAITFFSFLCSNNLIPISNLKFQTRLRDISKQKPTLNLEQGVFNEDFGGFIIYIGKKEPDNKSIKDVIIYDHKDYTKNKLSMITAETGEMFLTGDNSYFVMNLKNGTHYQEGEEDEKDTKDDYPFIRTNFEQWTKVFDTKEFNIDLTDMNRFKNHYTMLSVRQLYAAIDSIDNRLNSYNTRLDEFVLKNYHPLKVKFQDERNRILKEKKAKREEEKRKKEAEKEIKRIENPKKIQKDTTSKKTTTKPEIEKKRKKRINQKKPVKIKPKKPKNVKTVKSKSVKNKNKNNNSSKEQNNKKATEKKKNTTLSPIHQDLDRPITEYANFYETIRFEDRAKFNLKDRAKTSVRGIINQSQATQRSLGPKKESRVKHVFVLYSKITFALVCCVFLFIGAPMGAIVRKGGFGYPLLIAILFFMLFIILNILFQKLAESYVLKAEIAVWCPILVLIPIGIILTKRAMEDKKVVNLDRITTFIKNGFIFLKKVINRKNNTSTI